jgi:hypothetical protein
MWGWSVSQLSVTISAHTSMITGTKKKCVLSLVTRFMSNTIPYYEENLGLSGWAILFPVPVDDPVPLTVMVTELLVLG